MTFFRIDGGLPIYIIRQSFCGKTCTSISEKRVSSATGWVKIIETIQHLWSFLHPLRQVYR